MSNLQRVGKYMAKKGWVIDSITNEELIVSRKKPVNSLVLLFGILGLLFYIVPGLLILLVGYAARETETLLITAADAEERVKKNEAEKEARKARELEAAQTAKSDAIIGVWVAIAFIVVPLLVVIFLY